MANQQLYYYKAINANGDHVSGSLFSSGEKDAVAFLKRYYLVPVRLRKYPNFLFIIELFFFTYIPLMKPSKRKILNNLKQLKDLMQANFSIIEAVETIAHGSYWRIDKYRLFLVAQNLRMGIPLSYSLSKHYNVLDTAQLGLLQYSEQSGSLLTALEAIIEYRTQMLKSGGEMFLWLIPLCFITLLSMSSINYIANSFGDEALYQYWLQGIDLSKNVATFQAIFSGNLVINTALGFIFASTGIVLLKKLIQIFKLGIYLDLVTLKLPIIKDLVRLKYLEQFTQSLALSLKTKMPLHLALETVRNSFKHKYYREQLTQLLNAVNDGQEMGTELGSFNLLKATDVLLIRNAMKSNNVEKTISSLMELIKLHRQMRSVIMNSAVKYSIIGCVVGSWLWCLMSVFTMYMDIYYTA